MRLNCVLAKWERTDTHHPNYPQGHFHLDKGDTEPYFAVVFFYGCECIYMQLLCQCKVGNTVSPWYFLRQLDFCKACTAFSVCRRAQQREVSVKKIKKSHRE